MTRDTTSPGLPAPSSARPSPWSLAAAALVGLTALAGTAHAQSQAEIAAKLNDEGKELMYGNKFAEASKKFQEAVARVPEAKYFLNLCFARFQEGKFDEALTACNAVELNNPKEETKAKADKLIVKIREQAKSQNLELHPGGGGGGDPGPDPNRGGRPPDPRDPRTDPRNQPPPPTYRPVVGRPPDQNLALTAPPEHKYTWTLGVDFFGGGGRVGQPEAFASGGPGVRFKADYLVNPATKLGTQGYLQLTHLEPGASDSVIAEQLDIFDIGVAGYKHLCLGRTPRACVTPLVGVHLTLMSPAGEMDGFGQQVFNYSAVGARGELSFAWAFGRRYEHVFSAMIGANVYSPVLAGPSSGSGAFTAGEIGLDAGGALLYLGLGYTYRFNTPLGTTPFITLE